AQQAHSLRLFGDQVHLDAMTLAIIDRAMHEGGNVEIAAEFAVDANQDVEIELRGDAGSIVIGVVKYALVLFEIDTDDHLRAFAQNLPRAAQERARLVRLEIAERRSRKEPDLGHPFDLGGQGERRGEVGGNRINGEIGKILAQGVRLRVQEVAGNVDGDIGAEIAAFQQQADLGGCTGAEFHQRGTLGDDGRDLVAAAAQNAELG